MNLIAAILVTAVGLVMLLKPDFFWQIEVTCAMKDGRSTRGYRVMMRLLGLVCTLLPWITMLVRR